MKLRNNSVTQLAVYLGRMHLSMLLCVFGQRVGGEMTQKRRRADTRDACSRRADLALRDAITLAMRVRSAQIGRNTAVVIDWIVRRMVRL
jgi:hypothetical protein